MKSNAHCPEIPFLAVIPLLGQIKSVQTAFVDAGFICLVFWLTIVWFSSTRYLFPKSVFKLAVLLWLMSAGQILFYLKAVHPLWMACCFLLLFEHYKSDFDSFEIKKTLIQGFSFWFSAIFIGFVQMFLADHAKIHLFYTPAGMFLILAVFVYLYGLVFRKQPEVKP
ncbi:MAG: hypothetical protein H6757_03550 [Candidatus Omnitrophica bacterium]|nr:hypothetical protein [Candidatus Omnitrophota bacterium]